MTGVDHRPRRLRAGLDLAVFLLLVLLLVLLAGDADPSSSQVAPVRFDDLGCGPAARWQFTPAAPATPASVPELARCPDRRALLAGPGDPR